MGKERRRTGAGGVVFKRCPACFSEVLSAFRGQVTAVGRAQIVGVTREGNIIGKCELDGREVVWERNQNGRDAE